MNSRSWRLAERERKPLRTRRYTKGHEGNHRSGEASLSRRVHIGLQQTGTECDPIRHAPGCGADDLQPLGFDAFAETVVEQITFPDDDGEVVDQIVGQGAGFHYELESGNRAGAHCITPFHPAGERGLRLTLIEFRGQ